MAEIQPHTRINDILLAPLEKPTLQWLARRMPAWVTPDFLTCIGILGAVTIFVSYLLSNRSANFLWLANLGLIVNWFGDSLDGTLARYRQIERPKAGYFIDHTVDSFNETLIALGLGLSPYVTFSIACLGLIGYLLMSILVYIRTYVYGVFQISYGKFGPTEVRVIFILLNILMFYYGVPQVNLPLKLGTIYDLAIALIALVLFCLYITGSIRDAVKLAKLNEQK